MNLGKIMASLTLNVQNFMSGLNHANMGAARFGQAMANSLGQTQLQITQMGKSFKDVERIVSGILISQMFYRATNAIQDSAAGLVGFMNNMEKARISMEFFLGSAERAQGFLMNMKDFAAETAFNTEQAVVLSRRLMGAQFDPSQIRSVMEVLNDASSVTGATADQIDRIVLALSQMKTNGKIAGQELRQFAEAGIPIYKILAEELHLTGEELMNIGDLKISGDAGVAAVLTGLEKRYKGAAERIANTVPGMWDTIKDDMRILGEQMFQSPYNALSVFLRRIRDGMETARNILVKEGLGGVFEHFIPPELQDTIRTVIGSIQSLGMSLVYLHQALWPVISAVGTAFTQALAIVGPPLAMIVRMIVSLATIAIQGSSVVRFFATVVASLMVAQLAARALMLLWAVTRMGAICAAVGRAVLFLSEAIVALWAAAQLVNPWILLLIASIGMLSSMLLRSKGVSSGFSHLFGGIGKSLSNGMNKLQGFNINKILQPTQGKSQKDWTAPFNKGLDDMKTKLKDATEGVKKVGNEAKKTGKKLKDSFLASFDEVHTIPDSLDAAAAGLKDIGKGAGSQMPDLGLGNIADGFNVGNLPPMKLPSFEFPSLWKQLKKFFKDSWKAIKDWGKRMWDALVWTGIKFIVWSVDTYNTIKDWISDTTSKFLWWVGKNIYIFAKWVSDGIKSFIIWSGKTIYHIAVWTDKTIKAIGKWIADTAKSFGGWVVNVAKTFGKWVTDTGGIIANWIQDQFNAFTRWVSDVSKAFGKWATDTWNDFKDWSKNTAKTISTWASDRWNAFSKWTKDVRKSITTWSANTWADFKTWSSNTAKSLGDWATTRWNAFKTWSTNVGNTISTWASNTWGDFKTWVSDTGKSLGNWATNRWEAFKTWSSNTRSTIGTWATKSWESIKTWSSNTASTISSWTSNRWEAFKAWSRNTRSTIGTWVTNVKESFRTWARNVGSTVSGWVENIKGYIQKVKDISFGSWTARAQEAFRTMKSAITGYFSGMWTEIKESLNTIIRAFNRFTSYLSNLKIKLPKIDLPGGNFIGGYSWGVPTIGKIPELATGGIVRKDQLIRAGEKNRPEAVVPLGNGSYMRPFSEAVAADLAELIGGGGGSKHTTIINLTLGALIGDERSLRLLERKLAAIRDQEGTRGITYGNG